MILSSTGLRQLLENNVVELKFTRKRIQPGRPITRRMLASLNSTILDSDLGRQIFNFKSPSQAPAYNVSTYNLITVFDLFMQDWRNIPSTNVEVIRVLKCNPPEEFWLYFKEVISKLSAAQKAAFMDK